MIRARLRFTFSIGVLVAVAGCKQGPDYARPEYDVPGGFREGGEAEAVESFGDREWFEVFDDPVLQELIRTALQENYDVRTAAERVIEARAFVTIARADLYPDVQAGSVYQNTRSTENGPTPIPPGVDEEQDQWSLFLDLAWELDFWGRFRRATEAARAELAATELARRTVIQTLVSDLALAYFELLEFDEELEITRRTLESRQRSFDLVALRVEEGVSNKVEYYQAESLVIATSGIIPELEQLIEQQENLIRVLIGGNPGPIPRGRPLLEQRRAVEVPVGLPAELLERRPDVRAAEESLVAANARIGEAKALLFPAIRLTALGGVASEDLSDLFESDSRIWDLSPSVTLPVFNAGRLRSNVEVTESQQRQAALRYLQTLQIAFREVADALIAHEKSEEIRGWREQLRTILSQQVELSRDRYRGGVTSYLEVLDSERDHFDSEIDLARSIRNELFANVLLYRALGGGWQGAEELAAVGPQGQADGDE